MVMSSDCEVCEGTADIEVIVFEPSMTVRVSTEITDESLWMLHQRYNVGPADVFEYYLEQALDDVRARAEWHAFVCEGCWKNEFEGGFGCECERCRVRLDDGQDSYEVHNISGIDGRLLEGLDCNRSARGLSDAAAECVREELSEGGGSVVCSECLGRLKDISCGVGLLERVSVSLRNR